MTAWFDYANYAIAISGITISLLGMVFQLRIHFLPHHTKSIYLLFFTYTLLHIFAQLALYFFGISPGNVRDSAFIIVPLAFIPSIIILLVNMFMLFKKDSRLGVVEQRVLFIYHMIPIFFMLFQLITDRFFLISFGSTLAALFMFIHIINMSGDKYIEQRVKIAEQDFMARALQIRPHFIYNTLSNVYYLCELDPLKAQKVIDDFSTYLKKNFSAVAKQGLVSFEEELEHTKAYVAVVQARYEDMLFVDYDTPLVNFKLPPLTLEPLVENAVKHALDPDSEPLYIMIRTRRENSFNLIIVENTGENFPFDENDSFLSSGMNDEPHIGLSNVKSRLAASCGGSLTLSKRTDGGTIATIRIPTDQTAFSANKKAYYRSLNIN